MAEAAPVWNVMLATCPSRTSLAKIANKWTAMIVIALSDGPLRFGTIRERVQGISGKVLSETLRDLERVAVQFTSDLRRVAMQSSAAGENVITDLRTILEDALERIKSEIFRPGSGPGSGHEEAEGKGPGTGGTTVMGATRVQVVWQRGDWRVVAPPGGRYSLSQTVSSCWFRKWLGVIVQPCTFARCGTMRCHWKPMMKCTSSS